MEVIFGLVVLALFAAGPIGFLLALSLRGRVTELQDRIRSLELDLRHSRSEEPRRTDPAPKPIEPAPPHRDVVVPPPSPAKSPAFPDAWSTPEPASAELAPSREQPPPAPAIEAAPPAAGGTPRQSGKKVEDWEQYVGGSLLNRVGVALLVLGIAFALGYTFNQLDAAGKSVLATTVSLALIGVGCLLERKERYAYQGRGLIAGGWAALYVTVYAMHGLDATRVIDDVRVAFALLLLVGGGMIVHSLRYAQQGVTAIAYSLAYGSIVVHSIHAYTLVASILLGAGTLLHLFRRGWRSIALLGLAASYGSVLLWFLRQPFIDPAALDLALAAIGVNWLVFLAADFFANESKSGNDLGIVGSWANAAAGVLLATLVFVKSGEPGRHLPALVAGVAYVATTIAGMRFGWSAAAANHPILGAVALGYAAWLGLDLEGAAWVWLALAEIAYLVGLRRGDARLRTFGALAFVAPLLGLARDRLPLRAHYEIWDFPGAFDFGTVAFTITAWACLQFTAWKQRGLARGADGRPTVDPIAAILSHGSIALVVLALVVQVPSWTLAPILAALALVHFELGRASNRADVLDQTRWLAALACFFGLFGALDLPGRSRLFGLSDSVFSTLLFAAPIYALCARASVHRDSEHDLPFGRHAFAWVATFYLNAMIGYQAPESMRGLYHAALASVLVVAGIRFAAGPLRGAGYLFAAVSIAALIGFSVTTEARWRDLPVAVTTTLPALAMLAVVWWIVRRSGDDPTSPRVASGDEICGRALGYGVVATTYALLVNRMAGDDAVLTLPAFLVALHFAGRWLRDADLRLMSRVAAVMTLAAVTFAEDLRLSAPFGASGDVVLVANAVAALVVVGLLERRVAAGEAVPDRRALGLEAALRRLPDLSFLLAVAITVIHVGRTREGFGLSVGWALEGLVATIAGFALKARGLRLCGLFVLGLALLVTLWRAFTTFDTIGRIVSFLVLGGVLVLLSLAYARRRDADKRPPDATNPQEGRDAA